MAKTLSQLRKERNRLLKSSKARELTSNRKKAKDLERQRLKREITLLKNPKLTKAGAEIRKGLGRFSKSSAKFLKNRAEIISENVREMDRQERMEEMKKKSRSRKRPKARRTTIKRRRRR